jgi:FkbM family methyltransferase
MFKNVGQRGATNIIYSTGFFDNCKYVMISDHDNIFHESLDVYCDKLDTDKTIWCTIGYCSLEHDIERKDWVWLIKSTARAGHLVFRAKDFLSMMPIDINYNAGTNCSWFAGLDWNLTWWNSKTPGYRREKEFIACLPGGVEHAGSLSTWQGIYTADDPTQEEAVWMQDVSLQEIIKKYPPRHQYLSYKYKYEKEDTTDSNLTKHVYNIFTNTITIYDIKGSTSPDYIYQEMKDDEYGISNINFQDGDIVLDLGANVGIFSIALAKMYPTIKIYAFEPLKQNYDNLLLNLAANNIKNVIPLNYAITKDSRELIAVSSKMMSGGAHVIDSNLINNVTNTDNFLLNTCKSISLKQIFKDYNINKVKLLKIDIEGFEFEVIKNSWGLFKNIEYLSGEFHFYGGEDLKQLCREFFKPEKIKITCIAENHKKPKNLKNILKTISDNTVDVNKDYETLTKR